MLPVQASCLQKELVKSDSDDSEHPISAMINHGVQTLQINRVQFESSTQQFCRLALKFPKDSPVALPSAVRQIACMGSAVMSQLTQASILANAL